MTRRNAAALLWTPRIAGIAFGLFLGLFALDELGDGEAFLLHLLPSIAVLGVVALSWRFPLAGACAFTGMALAYAISVHWRLDWMAVIATPLVVIALLFVASWRYRAASTIASAR